MCTIFITLVAAMVGFDILQGELKSKEWLETKQVSARAMLALALLEERPLF